MRVANDLKYWYFASNRIVQYRNSGPNLKTCKIFIFVHICFKEYTLTRSEVYV